MFTWIESKFIHSQFHHLSQPSDRFRTMVNVEGDSFGAAIVAKLSKKDLEKSDEIDALENGEVTFNGKKTADRKDSDLHAYTNGTYAHHDEDNTPL